MSRRDDDDPALEPSHLAPVPETLDRLWTPWRMQYVGGDQRFAGCLFCLRATGTDDVRNLILHRGQDAFVIMNLFPYNTGHVMLVPFQHVSSPETVDHAATAELAQLRAPVLRALRRALGCQAFNLGLNVGPEAGAGIAEHMHEHVVPRWTGDANFMPILANTMVLPEMIPVTYAKLRTELARELRNLESLPLVVFDPSRTATLVNNRDRLGQTQLQPGVAAWASARATLRERVDNPTLIGWAGDSAVAAESVALTFQADVDAHVPEATATGWHWRLVDDMLTSEDGPIIQRALENLLESGAEPGSS